MDGHLVLGQQGGAVGAVDLHPDGAVEGVVVAGKEGIHRAVFQRDGGVGLVLHLDAAQHPAGGVALHPHRVHAGHVPHQVDGVDGLVNDHAAALGGPAAFPVALVIAGRAVPVQRREGALDLAQLPAQDQLADALDAVDVAVLEDDAQLPAGGLLGGDHAVGLLQRDGDGLFGQHVHAGGHGGHRVLAVQVMGQQDVHQLRPAVGQRRRKARAADQGAGLAAVKGGGEGARAGRVLVHGQHDLALVAQVLQRGFVHGGDPAAAHHRHTQFFHGIAHPFGRGPAGAVVTACPARRAGSSARADSCSRQNCPARTPPRPSRRRPGLCPGSASGGGSPCRRCPGPQSPCARR